MHRCNKVEAGVARREKYMFQKDRVEEKLVMLRVELICKSQTPSRTHTDTHFPETMPELTLWGQMGGGELKDFSSVGLRFYKKNTL